MALANKKTKRLTWEAFVMYDPASTIRVGIYGSRKEATNDCPGWRDEGYVIEPCEIATVKKHVGA